MRLRIAGVLVALAALAGCGGLRSDAAPERVYVLNPAPVAQGAPADAEDHRPVPRDQGREGGLVAAAGEPLQELTLAQARDGPGREQPLDLSQHGTVRRAGHLGCSLKDAIDGGIADCGLRIARNDPDSRSAIAQSAIRNPGLNPI